MNDTPVLDDIIKIISFVATVCLIAWAIYYTV